MNAFSLPNIFFGIYLIIPLLLGLFLVFGINVDKRTLTKAQRLAGTLFLIDAFYLMVRTYLLTVDGLDHHLYRHLFFILDSTIITLFTLIPYVVVQEKYPSWWMHVIAMIPILAIPTLFFTNRYNLTIWTHLIPLTTGSIVLEQSIQFIRKSDKQLENKFADPEYRSKSWLIYINISFLLLTLASMMRYVIHGIIWYNMLVSLMWSALMIAIYIFLVNQKPARLVNDESLKNNKDASTVYSPTENKFKISIATEEKMLDEIDSKIQKICVENQLYLRSDISVDTLAIECGTNRTYLYHYLRERKNQTFYEFINTMRLNKVDELLPNTRLAQDAIAAQCGFNSARTMRSAYFKIRGKELARPE